MHVLASYAERSCRCERLRATQPSQRALPDEMIMRRAAVGHVHYGYARPAGHLAEDRPAAAKRLGVGGEVRGQLLK